MKMLKHLTVIAALVVAMPASAETLRLATSADYPHGNPSIPQETWKALISM